MRTAITHPRRQPRRVFLTAHTAYYVRGTTCVAVRERGGAWLDHEAIGRRLEGSLRVDTRGGVRPVVGHSPTIGEHLCFSGDIVTSPLRRIVFDDAGSRAARRAA